MLGSLLDDMHEMHPDDLLDVVRRKGALAHLGDIEIWAADKDQRELRALHDANAEPLMIDGSIAGRAYQRSDVVVSDAADDSGRVAWFPILDGTARMGVMRAHL